MSNRIEAALEYRRRGYFPTPTAGKRPVQEEWEKSRLGEDDIRRAFRPSHNVGIILGASGLADIDFDDEVAVSAWRRIDPPELRNAASFEHAGRPHLIVRAIVPTRRFKRADGTVLLELRGEGAQTIFPPSIHQDGLPYTWTDDCEPPAVDSLRLQTIALIIATAAYASEFWKPKGRHDLALALSGFLARRLPPNEVVEVIRAAGSIAGDDELDDRLRAVETTVQRLQAGEDVTGLPTLDKIAGDLAKALASWWGTREHCGTEGAGHAGGMEKRNAADRLVDYALASGAQFFRDEQEQPFVAVQIDGRRQILGLSSRQAKRWLARLNWQHEKKAANGETITTAVTALSSFAVFDGPQHELNVRVARVDGAIWYDLGDWRAIRIDQRGWHVVDEPPILFRHFQHQRAQPEPLRGGNLWHFLDIVNLQERSQQVLLLVYLVSALVQGIPRPVVVVHGEHGSGKSTLLFFLRELIDPSVLRPQSAPDNIREFVQAASHNLCLYLDNVSHLPDWLSDALCRLCTGDGFSKRQLYTDDDDIIYSLRGLGGVNGINLVATRADLLDRALLLTLGSIADAERLTEQECLLRFEALKPYLLGAMFEVLSAAMGTVDDIQLDLPRMADFARWGCAIARRLGCDDAEFLRALGVNTAAQNETAVENSPVAQTVIRLVEDEGDWEDTPAATLQRLASIAGELQLDTKGRAWPKQPAHLTRRLTEVAPNLKRLGVVISWSRTGRRRLIAIHGSGSGVTAVTEPENAVTGDGDAVTDDATNGGRPDSFPSLRDGSDAGDGTLAGVAADEWEVT